MRRRYATLFALAGAVVLGSCGKAARDPASSQSAPAASATASSTGASGSSPAVSAPPTPAPAPSAKLSGPARLPDRLVALGTEPFWNVSIDGARLVYTTPDDQKGQSIAASRDDTAISSTWTGKLGSKPFELSIVPEKCSDGMSDTEYPFSARLKVAGAMHHGCARVVR